MTLCQLFSNELAVHIKWSKYWSFSFSSCPSNEYSGLIFFRIDWFDLFAIQGTLKTLVQHHNLKASVLQHSVFVDKHSHLYMATGKTIALTVLTFVGKLMSLLFNMLSRFVVVFLPRCKLSSVQLFSRIQLFVIDGLQPTRLLCPWNCPTNSGY